MSAYAAILTGVRLLFYAKSRIAEAREAESGGGWGAVGRDCLMGTGNFSGAIKLFKLWRGGDCTTL